MKGINRMARYSVGIAGAALLLNAAFPLSVSSAGVWFGWQEENGKQYWYENGVKQGTTGRGKEIYDPSSDGWYWLDAVQGGAKAVSKDVYQESYSAYPDRPDGTGKWVRYDENGRMIKGWQTTEKGTYYFEEITGSMAKGEVSIGGKNYVFDVVTGILQDAREEEKEPVEVVNAYYTASSYGSTLYYLVVKNNSAGTAEIGAEVIAKDASGKMIGAVTNSEYAVPNGHETCIAYYFSDCSDAASFEYSLYYEPERYYAPVVQNLTHEESRTDRKVIVSCTNHGGVAAEFVECTALFFRNGKLIRGNSAYFTDNDSELKPGKTITREIYCFEEYDDVKLYFTGRRRNR